MSEQPLPATKPAERRRHVLLYEGREMTMTSPAAAATADPTQLSGSFLSCYEITNPASLAWPVRLYTVVRADGSGQSHGARGEIKQALWVLRKTHSSFSPRYGLVVDVDEETVAVPAGWELPSGEQVGDYRVTLGQSVTTNPASPAHRSIISGILREAMKAHFKNHGSNVLGDLYAYSTDFCHPIHGKVATQST